MKNEYTSEKNFSKQDKKVHLKPMFGMKPGLWLFICYSFGFLVLFFCVTILPGIIRGYNIVTFKNQGVQAAVYLDDRYLGGTPFTVDVPSGVHNVKYVVSDSVADEFEIKINHPVFLSWLFPRTLEVSRSANMTEETFRKQTKTFLQDVTAWSAVLSFDNNYKYPPLFTNYAKSISSYNYSEEAFKYAAQFITSKEMLADAKEAFRILNIRYDFEKIEEAVKNRTFRTSSKRIYGTIKGTSTLEGSEFSVLGFTFGDFSIASVTVNETMYASFIDQNPYWAASNKAELIKAGLVDEYYLDGITLDSRSVSYKPIRNISFHAAKAFCEWLSKDTGKNVFLPTESQWTAAASSAELTYTKTLTAIHNGKYPAGMLGGVWEYTSTYYIPNETIMEKEIQAYLTDLGCICEPIVKGGCYTNDPTEISPFTIGIQSPYLCNEFYGFRVAWN